MTKRSKILSKRFPFKISPFTPTADLLLSVSSREAIYPTGPCYKRKTFYVKRFLTLSREIICRLALRCIPSQALNTQFSLPLQAHTFPHAPVTQSYAAQNPSLMGIQGKIESCSHKTPYRAPLFTLLLSLATLNYMLIFPFSVWGVHYLQFQKELQTPLTRSELLQNFLQSSTSEELICDFESLHTTSIF